MPIRSNQLLAENPHVAAEADAALAAAQQVSDLLQTAIAAGEQISKSPLVWRALPNAVDRVEQLREINRVRSLELEMAELVSQARNVANGLAENSSRFRPLARLFVDGTNPVVTVLHAAGDLDAYDFQIEALQAAYLQSRGVISLRPGVDVALADMLLFQLFGQVKLEDLSELLKTFQAALSVHFINTQELSANNRSAASPVVGANDVLGGASDDQRLFTSSALAKITALLGGLSGGIAKRVNRQTLAKLQQSWRRVLLDLPRYTKRTLLVASDLALLELALWASVSLRYGEYYTPDDLGEVFLFIAGPLITVAVFGWIGLYRLVTRYISYRGTIQIFAGVATSVLIWSVLVFMFGQLGVPRSSIVLYGFCAAALITMSRQLAGIVLRSAGIPYPSYEDSLGRKPVVIYGAGPMGVQLLASLRNARDREAIGFVDDQPTMWGQYIGGVKVYRPERLEFLIRRQGAREVLLALPGSYRRERRKILQDLERLQVEVKVLPAYEDLTSGRVGVQDLRAVDVGELLGREPVQPNAKLLERNTRDKSVLVTGAGGSIGSEMVRQILKQAPSRLVLLDSSEVALYEIDIEVQQRLAEWPEELAKPEIVSVLGSVLDASLVSDVMRTNSIETVYHAAAYKHVPIVEHNPIAGLNNNVFGTAVVAQAARDNNVERVVLISTDKAVRPTNVMGASKRLAELVLQAHAADTSNTVFTMVRFGNVLDSSGSVVRRFRKQIESGGPVTVTHKDIERYFMSIPEAAELVLQAGAMATGGEVFVLHMGDPVKIDSLARLMIHLSGLEVRDSNNLDGDISIAYTGLRPGEKLYEELLIGANTTGTEHQRIWTSAEPYLAPADLKHELDVLQAAMAARDIEAIQGLLLRTVEGYRPSEEAVRAADASTRQAVWTGATRTMLH